MNNKPVPTTSPNPVLMADVPAAALVVSEMVVLASSMLQSTADGTKQQQPQSSTVIEMTHLAFYSASTDASAGAHDTCPQCPSSATTSFVTFDELTDVDNIFTAIGCCANNSVAD